MPSVMPTPTRALRVCAHCSVNITGLAMSAQNPRSGNLVSLCSYCANNAAVAGVCESCRTLMSPSAEMLTVGGHRYCEADDPTPRTSCASCGRLHRAAAGLVMVPGSTEGGRGRGRVEARAYCDRSCATSDGVRFEGSRAYRPEFSNGVEVIPWDSADESFPVPPIAGADASFGMEIEAMLRRCPVGWEVHHDGSIGEPHNRPDGEYRPLEIVSPILYGRAGMASAAGALDTMARGDHFRRANNAGFHVHVGVEHLTKAALLQVFHHWHRWGEHMAAGLVARNRLTNQYCRSMRGSLGSGVIGFLQESFSGMRDSTPVSSLRRSLGRISSRYDRYLTLNHHSIAKHGTVEFRLWSCSTTPRNILGWTAFCVRFVEAAVRLAHEADPVGAAAACRQHGVMRTGLRLLRADPAFSTWVRERWGYLAARSSLAESHLASAAHNPWGRRGIAGQPPAPPETPRPRRRRTPRAAETPRGAVATTVTLDERPVSRAMTRANAALQTVVEATERAMRARMNDPNGVIEAAMREGVGFGPESLAPARAGGSGSAGMVTVVRMEGGAGGAGGAGGTAGSVGASAVAGDGSGGAGAVVRHYHSQEVVLRGEPVVFGADFGTDETIMTSAAPGIPPLGASVPPETNERLAVERLEEIRRSQPLRFQSEYLNTFGPARGPDPDERAYLDDGPAEVPARTYERLNDWTRPPSWIQDVAGNPRILAAVESVERAGRLIDERHETDVNGYIRSERTYLSQDGEGRVTVMRLNGRIAEVRTEQNHPDPRRRIGHREDWGIPPWNAPPATLPASVPIAPRPARAPRTPQGRVGRRRRRPVDPDADQTE